ncbi:MAG: beta-galactosidase [Caldilinea sp.]|nr:beta-galactosidase [Caldilinea sp.]MDW8441778.1 beta-galactosidase [Caldilineaceae bacterium]
MPNEPFLPIAVWYTGGRTRATMVRPPDADSPRTWKRDLEAIKACGFNTVRCWVDWAGAEPQPGDYRFDALDLLMDLTEQLDLKVICQLYLDSAPDWLVHYYPDCRYVSAGGIPVDSQGAPGYCYDNPGVRTAAERFMVEVARRLAPRPTFYAWDLWSEPHIVQWGYFDYLPQPPVFCYCHHTVQRFRDWLRRRYGALDALNRAWYRTFTSWDVIPAPKFISLMTYTEYIDWIHFIMEKLACDLRWRHDTIRQVDHHLTTSHSAVPSVLTLPLDEQGSPDDWKMPHSVDIWGTSLYPKHVGAKETGDPSFRAAMLTSTRSACDAVGKPYWLGELQAGHGYVGMFASHMTAVDARHYTWHALAHGAKGLCFYAWHPMSSGYESGGFGMAHLDGSPSDRAVAAGSIAQVVEQEMEYFVAGKTTPAEVAICWNVHANIMWQCMRQTWHYIPSRSYIGAYRAFFQEHLPTDFIHPDQIVAGELKRYKLLALPFSFMTPRTMAAAIADWVSQGGIVVAEARTGWNDETGYCGDAIPGFGLEKVFGCREQGAQGVDEQSAVQVRIVRKHPLLPRLDVGDVLSGARFREALEPLTPTAEVVGEFEDGAPAIVVNRFGQGWGVFVGTMLSLGFYRFGNEKSGDFLKGLADAAGIRKPVTVCDAPAAAVEPRLLEGRTAGKRFWLFFGFNHSATSLAPTWSLELPAGAYTAIDIATRQLVSLRWKDGRAVLQKQLEPQEIWVVKIVEA